MPFKRKGSPFWYVKINGIRRSTGTTDRRLAERIEKEWREPASTEFPTFDKVITHYVSVSQYERAAWAGNAMLPYFGGRPIEEITPLEITSYKRRRKVGDATIRKELGVLRAAIRRYNNDIGATLPDITKGHIPKQSPSRLRWLTRAEYAALIEQAGKSPKAPYLPDVIALAVNTGLRVGEILGLTWERADLDNRLIYLNPEDQKSRRFASVPINNNAARILQKIEKKGRFVIHNKEGEQVKSIKRSFRTAANRAGLEDFRIHDLRHTCAAWMVQSGVPIRTVSEILRHADISTTMIYAHLSPDNAREGVAALDECVP